MMISKMISFAILSYGLCHVYLSLYETHRPAMSGESR